MDKKARCSLVIDRELLIKLKYLCLQEGVTISKMLETLLLERLERENNKKRDK